MSSESKAYLEATASEESGNDQGYDSEAAELSKGRRSLRTSEGGPSKRRKLSDADSGSDTGNDAPTNNNNILPVPAAQPFPPSSVAFDHRATPTDKSSKPTTTTSLGATTKSHESQATNKPTKGPRTDKTPGVIYLSSLPPYLRPSALRNLLTQRGFEPITRLFLAPASKPTRGPKSKSNSTSTNASKRQLYSEGWLEFASKATAKLCARTLNAAPVGGKKGGFYRDDVWNMKYLRGMRWEELMAGVREERREEEGRRDEERLVLARETKRFVEGVEKGRQMKGIEGSRMAKAKRKKSDEGTDEDDHHDKSGGGGGLGSPAEEVREVKRTWRQFEVKGKSKSKSRDNHDTTAAVLSDLPLSEDVRTVLGKIF